MKRYILAGCLVGSLLAWNTGFSGHCASEKNHAAHEDFVSMTGTISRHGSEYDGFLSLILDNNQLIELVAHDQKIMNFLVSRQNRRFKIMGVIEENPIGKKMYVTDYLELK